MSNIIEYEGTWFMPNLGEKPFKSSIPIDNARARPQSAEGKLIIDPQNYIKLIVRGNFLDTRLPDRGDDEVRLPAPDLSDDEAQIINGALYTLTRATTLGTRQPFDPAYVTLYKASQTRVDEWTGKGVVVPRSAEFSAEWAFLGASFNNPEDVRFDHLVVQFPHLNSWSQPLGLTLPRLDESNRYDPADFSASFEKPPTSELAKTEEYEILLDVEGYAGVSAANFYGADSVTLTQTSYIHIKTSQPREIEYFERLIDSLGAFLSFSMRRRISASSITQMKDKIRSIRIYNPLLMRYGAPKGEPTPPYTMLTKPSSTLVRNWMEQYDRLRTLYALYFSSISDTQASEEYRFLSMCQVLEGYHRLTAASNKMMDRDTFRGLREAMLNAIPEEHRDWMMSKVAHANEPNLKKRLEELVQPYRDIFELHIPDIASLISSVAETRNNLTHPNDEPRKGVVVSLSDLPLLRGFMQTLFELWILRDLGIEMDSKDSSLLMRIGHGTLRRLGELFPKHFPASE